MTEQELATLQDDCGRCACCEEVVGPLVAEVRRLQAVLRAIAYPLNWETHHHLVARARYALD